MTTKCYWCHNDVKVNEGVPSEYGTAHKNCETEHEVAVARMAGGE